MSSTALEAGTSGEAEAQMRAVRLGGRGGRSPEALPRVCEPSCMPGLRRGLLGGLGIDRGELFDPDGLVLAK